MVVAQLAEWLFPISEVWGLNPVIGKKLYWTFTVNCVEKTKTNKKRPIVNKNFPQRDVEGQFMILFIILADEQLIIPIVVKP